MSLQCLRDRDVGVESARFRNDAEIVQRWPGDGHRDVEGHLSIGAERHRDGGERASFGGVKLTVVPRECLTRTDRKSTRLNSSHVEISYAVFCLKQQNSELRGGRTC